MKKYLLLSLLILTSITLFSQDHLNADDFLPKVVPPSPEAAALGKYADIPISNHNGSTNISIPIYEINIDGYKLPISLSYHASGIKQSEQASWVGLGWVLNAGGVVMRSAYGRDDFKHRINKSFVDPSPGVKPSFANYTYSMLYPDEGTAAWYSAVNTGNGPSYPLNGLYDTEPDIFSFNFNGRAGKFIYKTDGDAVLFPHQDLKIIKPLTFNDSTNFEIIDESGVIYYFDVKEKVNTQRFSNHGPLLSKEAYTAYYMSKIKLTNGKEITFNYDKQYYRTESAKNYSKGITGQVDRSQDECYIRGWYLESITWDGGSVEFNTADRDDYLEWYSNMYPPQKLTGILIKDDNGALIKRFVLDQSYFNPNSTDPNDKRLKLESLTEMSGTSSNSFPPHIFTYEQGVMGSKLKFGDHWGYFNGEESDYANGIYIGDNDSFQFILSYTRREPSYPEMKVGILTEIQYPTGGKTVFNYEPHDYSQTLYESSFTECETNTISHSVSAFPNEGGSNVISTTFYKPYAFDLRFTFDMYGLNCDGASNDQVNCNGTYTDLHYGANNQTKIRLVNTGNSTEIFYVKWTDAFDGKFYYSEVSTVLSQSGGYISSSEISSDKLYFDNLPSGNYKLEITIDPDFLSFSSLDEISATVSYSEIECEQIDKITAGGLRIKDKTDYDNTDYPIKHISYKYSGGKLFSEPKYTMQKPSYVNLMYMGILTVPSLFTEKNSGSLNSQPVGKLYALFKLLILLPASGKFSGRY